jgi:glyoxylase-like metal-dependent hydrolase (beta-lactamase superfamily II)/8-oxo-dGTP pyrophosphatase MutT (NUDIX family)
VLLARGPDPAELVVVRRARSLRFLGGFIAFPGGKVAPDDLELAAPSADERYVTAARELFEETGVLLARRPDDSFPPSGSLLDYLRRKLMAEEMTFAQVLQRLGVGISARDFQPLGSVTTPAFIPTRFDTSFFLARLPQNQTAAVWPGELEVGDWATAQDMLDWWTRGECLVSPPTVLILEAICGQPLANFAGCLGVLLDRDNGATVPAIPFAPDVELIPLYTQPLPPTTHTNAYLVGREPCYLLDPGAENTEEQARLFTVLDRRRAEGRPLTAIVLTHHHADHIGAVNAVAAHCGVPVYAHPITANRLEGKVPVTRRIEAGEHLDLGKSPDGSRPWYLEALHTPGHAPGHLVFWDPHYRLLFAGDMISTLSSMLIIPPDGDLAVYLESLRRLQGLDGRLLLPGHGSPTARYHEVLEEALAHRAMREEQLLAALDPGPRSVAELAETIYKGLPPALGWIAEGQVRSGLAKLEHEGRIEPVPAGEGQAWRRRPG